MPSLKTLMYARIASLLLAGACTVACIGLAGKSLKDLGDNREFLDHTLKKMAGGAIKGHIDATDVLGAMGAIIGAAGLGVIWCFISEFIWFKEERGGFLPWRLRFINEFMLGLSCLFLLAASIAGAIICGTHSAKIVLNPPLPMTVVDPILKSTGRSVKYTDHKAFPAMIMGWIAFLFLFISLILTILAGLHYRRVAAERRSSAGSNGTHEKVSEAHADHTHV